MSVSVLRADARHLPLPDASVDLIITSPPYFGLRSYTDGGEHYAGQIGSESTPQEWLEALWVCTAEWVRVLKPEGSLFINLGDKYSTSMYSHSSVRNVPQPDGEWSKSGWHGKPNVQTGRQDPAVPPKSLMGLPWRYAIGCMDRLGLILRAEIVWAKPNGLPESVTDRVRRAHEQVFHFTRLPRYYAAVDEIREPHQPQSIARTKRQYNAGDLFSVGTPNTLDPAQFCNPLGKLPGSVWPIPSQPLQVPASLGVDHFAAFPMELPRRLILGWSPPGVCTACHQGRRPVVHSLKVTSRPGFNVRDQRMPGRHASGNQGREGRAGDYLTTVTGYACACPEPSAPTRPAIILDPFSGTGTTILVASVLGRHGIGVDLSADYCRLAQWRITDPGERARAMCVPKPPKQAEGQDDLFGGLLP